MSAPAPRAVTEVAVGVLVRSDGAVLLADRPHGKPYAGYWEFPGGKIEPGETVDQALARELAEELGVRIGRSWPWAVLEHDYPHAYVRLHFHRIGAWQGEPRPLEGQRLRFHAAGDAAPSPLLPAAVAPLRWARLPAVCGISPGVLADAPGALAWLDGMLDRGLQLVAWHEPLLADAASLEEVARRAHASGVLLLVDSRHAVPAAAGCLLDPVALSAATQRPRHDWVAARVRDAADLAAAARLGCDFAIAEGPALVIDGGAPLPVYAPGPLTLERLEQVRAQGAQGLAVVI